jgi:hypothetical protein
MTTKKTVAKNKVTPKKPSVKTKPVVETITGTAPTITSASIGIDKVGNLNEVLEDIYKNVNLHRSALENHNDRFSDHFSSLVDLTVKLNGTLVTQDNVNNGLVSSIEMSRAVVAAEAKKLLKLTKVVAISIWVSAALWVSFGVYLIIKH